MEPAPRSSWRRFWHGLVVSVSGVVLALGCFLTLPLLRAITAPKAKTDMVLREAGVVEPPPPPPVEEDEPPPDDEEPPPPEPAAEAPPLDLAQLEMALSPGDWGGVGGAGAFALPVNALGGGGADMDDLFDFSGLEEEPQVRFRARPRRLTRDLKKATPCTVYVLFTVDEQGRVQNPTVHTTDDPRFNSYALEAIRQWRFEPGKRNGKPDSFRVRQPITFR